MAQPTTSASIEDLIDRAADLKGELVAFAQSPRFRRWLDVLLRDSADALGYLDEGVTVQAMDRFALQHRLPDGRTVVERFVAQRRPPLPDDERELVLGWGDVVEGCFEVGGGDGEAVELHNLLDDLVYRVHSNMGPPALAPLRTGTFAVCRIVPLRRATNDWLISGHISMYAASARRRLAQVAVEHVTANPVLIRRNPALFERSWEVQAEQRAAFIDQVGADLVVLPPLEAQETLREHYRCIRSQAVARLNGKAARRARTSGRLPEDAGRLPEELLDADTVALIYDEIEGLGYYRDFGHLDALFADPTQVRDRAGLAQLRAYLDDESIPPLVIRRLVERHPGGVDQIFRILLRKPGFTWSRDGEKLLRREKQPYFDREPVPSISIIGQRLVELLG